MEQALQTKQRFDLYGLHFESDQSAINADGNVAPRRHRDSAQELP